MPSLRSALYYTVFGVLVFTPISSHAVSELSPRAEVSVKGGSERSTLTTEFWAPLAQKSDRVVYTDLRLMGDDDDNREGNLGIGYRQVYAPTNSVLGIHGWIDRRRTEHNSTFHQITLGVESLGDKIDLRANGYVPLNSAHIVTTPNLGQLMPYLAGSGIFYDTNGSVNETPQYGMEAEAGYRLPIFEKQVDTVRVFGGSYYFFRDNTDSVLGGRARIETQINRLISVGARFQYDKPRGSQGFLEATLRFPFTAKKLYQQDKLRSRLDESPERDIDIVTASKVDNGLHKEITNTTTGQSQRVLYVDNTNSQNGNGTKENPFNNLRLAEANLQPYDIIYINHGDGTSHNMDQGITLSKPGITLIGSGSNFVYNSGRFSANNGEAYNGFLLQAASTAPIISNTQTSTDNFTGNAINIYASDATISGINISGANSRSISSLTQNGQTWHNLTITNVNATGNGSGIILETTGTNSGIENVYLNNITVQNSMLANSAIALNASFNSYMNNISLNNIILSGNNGNGVIVKADTGSRLGSVSIANTLLSNNAGNGAFIIAQGAGKIDTVSISDTTALNNMTDGIVFQSDGTDSHITQVNTTRTVTNNNTRGLLAIAQNGATIDNIAFINATAGNNVQQGIHFAANGGNLNNIQLSDSNSSNNGTGVMTQATISGVIDKVNISNVITNNNNTQGLYVVGQNNGVINEVHMDNVISIGNSQYGIYNYANGNSTIGLIDLKNAVSNNSVNDNIRVEAASGNNTIGSVSLSNVTANNGQLARGILIYANGGTIGSTSLSNVTANSNKTYGVWIYANGGTFNAAAMSDITANNNLSHGIVFQSATATSILNNVSLSHSNTIGNIGNGVLVQKSNASAILNIDLGGGFLGSIGQNRIFGNVANDIRIDGGYALSALNNWWGVATAPTRVTFNGGSTINATPFLSTDPRP